MFRYLSKGKRLATGVKLFYPCVMSISAPKREPPSLAQLFIRTDPPGHLPPPFIFPIIETLVTAAPPPNVFHCIASLPCRRHVPVLPIGNAFIYSTPGNAVLVVAGAAMEAAEVDMEAVAAGAVATTTVAVAAVGATTGGEAVAGPLAVDPGQFSVKNW